MAERDYRAEREGLLDSARETLLGEIDRRCETAVAAVGDVDQVMRVWFQLGLDPDELEKHLQQEVGASTSIGEWMVSRVADLEDDPIRAVFARMEWAALRLAPDEGIEEAVKREARPMSGLDPEIDGGSGLEL